MTLANLIYSAASSFNASYQVYPLGAPQEGEPPWITYRVTQISEQDSDQLTYQLGGAMNPYWATFYITIWNKTFDQVDSEVQPFVAHMLKIRGDGRTRFQKIEFLGREDMDVDDLTLFGSDLKFRGFTVEI